jgi:uncharacterized protein YaaW (UPF0174 family)
MEILVKDAAHTESYTAIARLAVLVALPISGKGASVGKRSPSLQAMGGPPLG